MSTPLDGFDTAAAQAAADAGMATDAPPAAKNKGGRPRNDGLAPGSPEARAADRRAAKASGKSSARRPAPGAAAREPEPEPEPVTYPEPTEQDVAAAKPLAAALLLPLAAIDGEPIQETEVDALAEPVAATLRYYLGDGPAHPLARVGVAAALISLPRVVHWYEQRKAAEDGDARRDEVPSSGFTSAAGSRALASA